MATGQTIEGTIREVSDDGERITLLGSVWIVNPVNILEACVWLPVTAIEIKGSRMRRSDDGSTLRVTLG